MKNFTFALISLTVLGSCHKQEEVITNLGGSWDITKHEQISSIDTLNLIPLNSTDYRLNLPYSGSTAYLNTTHSSGVSISQSLGYKLWDNGFMVEFNADTAIVIIGGYIIENYEGNSFSLRKNTANFTEFIDLRK